jgi:hypothetical protein
MKTRTVLFALTLSLSGAFAVAGPPPTILPPPLPFPPPSSHCPGARCMSAPEIDPASAMGALALLSGTIAIVRGRRSKK